MKRETIKSDSEHTFDVINFEGEGYIVWAWEIHAGTRLYRWTTEDFETREQAVRDMAEYAEWLGIW